jgi:hypothetical protein
MSTSTSLVLVRLLELQIGRAVQLCKETKSEFDAGRIEGLKEAYILAKTLFDDSLSITQRGKEYD